MLVIMQSTHHQNMIKLNKHIPFLSTTNTVVLVFRSVKICSKRYNQTTTAFSLPVEKQTLHLSLLILPSLIFPMRLSNVQMPFSQATKLCTLH